MKIKFLKADNGDSILLSFKDSEGANRNILIDGGIQKTYKTDKNPKGKIEFGELKSVIDSIKIKNEESIDLLIVTHIDKDHIGGIIKWFDDDIEASSLVKEVWFNSGTRIANFLDQPENGDISHMINPNKSKRTSVQQGVDFSKYIIEKKILYDEIISQNKTFSKFGLEFKILSPNKSKLELLLKNWKIKDPDLKTTLKLNDYNNSLKEHLLKDKFKEDEAFPNGSSIAFILTYKGENYLFLGDSHPSVIIEGLRFFNYSKSNRLKARLVKVAHHGSKANTNTDLLEYIESNDFVISTNGVGDQHPNKQTLARIINKAQKCNIYFNYKERMDIIFSDQDKLDFPDFKAIAITKEFEF